VIAPSAVLKLIEVNCDSLLPDFCVNGYDPPGYIATVTSSFPGQLPAA
jgi:hypothetical protein